MPLQGFPSIDVGAYLGGVWASISPTLSAMGGVYTSELARSLADWTPVLVALGLVALIVGLRSGRDQDDGGEEEDDAGMMGLLGGSSGGRPRLRVRSWNRQVDRYALATAKATKGGEEARKLQRKLKEGYVKLEKDETAAGAASKAKGGAEKAPADDEEDGAVELVEATGPRRVWVLRFQGGRNDVTAGGVQQLREEITAVVANADPARDEVVLRLDSPGGTVTGYGLAGAQLLRLREAGLRLTVAIDQVAASGGYLMACTAHHIVCSPFAVIGSIGVVQELPIVFERLKREGIQFETTTAGKYKRTLTPFKEPTDEDRRKNKADVEDVLGVFKEFVHSSRPSVDIDAVATGETWLGPRAKDKGLVDELKTSDALLLEHVREGRQVLEVTFARGAGNPLLGLVSSLVAAVGGALPGVRGEAAWAGAGGVADALSALPPSARLSPPMVRAQPGPMARYDSSWDAML